MNISKSVGDDIVNVDTHNRGSPSKYTSLVNLIRIDDNERIQTKE